MARSAIADERIEVLDSGEIRLELVAVVFDRPTIETTLVALGLQTRAPPIAPARRTGLFGDNWGDTPTATDEDPATEWH